MLLFVKNNSLVCVQIKLVNSTSTHQAKIQIMVYINHGNVTC